jgi:hypothetical protein
MFLRLDVKVVINQSTVCEFCVKKFFDLCVAHLLRYLSAALFAAAFFCTLLLPFAN